MTISFRSIHEKALIVAEQFNRSEIALLDVLSEVDVHRVWSHYDCTSLYNYAVKKMRLSESNALNFIAVARKSREVPELKIAIERKEISIATARKISSVINRGNYEHWLKMAKTLPKMALEKELARVNPKLATTERAKYVNEDRLELSMGLSEAAMLKLRRAQDLVSTNRRKAASLEDTLEELLEFYLTRKDPLEIAKRNVNKAPKNAAPANVPDIRAKKSEKIPALEKHKTEARDGGRCSHVSELGERCENRRWLEVHHIVPRSEGGTHTSANLTTLCHQHHKEVHLRI